MADNKYPNESFSVDDILNEVHAMREKEQKQKELKANAPKADMITPEEVMEIKVKPVEKSVPKDKKHRTIRPNTITPEEINGTNSITEDIEQATAKSKKTGTPNRFVSATENIDENKSVEYSEENDKLKSFFSKTRENTYVGDKEYAKKQIDELFGDDPDMVVAPLEKKRRRNANVLSPEEIKAKKPIVEPKKTKITSRDDSDISQTREFDKLDLTAENESSLTKSEIKAKQKEEKRLEKEKRAEMKAQQRAAKKEERERRKYEPDTEDLIDEPNPPEKIKEPTIPAKKAVTRSETEYVSAVKEPLAEPLLDEIQADKEKDNKTDFKKTSDEVASQNNNLKPVNKEKTPKKPNAVNSPVKNIDKKPSGFNLSAASNQKKVNSSDNPTENDNYEENERLQNIVLGAGAEFRPIRAGGVKIEELSMPEPENAEEIDDYFNIEDAESVRVGLDAKLASISKKSAFTFIFFVLLFIFTFLPCLNISLPSFVSPKDNVLVFLWINVILFALCITVNIKSVVSGLVSLFKLNPDIDTAISVAALAAMVQSIVALAMPEAISDGNGFLYTGVVAGAMLFNLFGKKNIMSRVRSNFDEVATTGIKQSCFTVAGKSARAMVEDKSIGKPYVACSRAVLNLHNFLFNSFCEDPADNFSRIVAPAGLIISILTGAIAYFISSDVMSSVGAIAAACAACVPLTSTLASSRAVSSAAKYVKGFGAMLSGYNAAEDFIDVDYLAVDAKELFPAGTVDLLSLKAVGKYSIDDVIMDAAALVIAAGGPLQDVFERMIDGRQSNVKKVDGIVYHNGLGISGTVGIDTVAVGNRKMIEAMGDVNLPDVEVEKKIGRNNCYAVYIARNEVLCGMLVVRYNEKDDDMTEQLQKLTEQGVTLLVKNCDPNVTEQLICRTFALEENTVQIMSPTAAQVCENTTMPRENGDSVISHNNSLTGYACAIIAAKKLYSTVKNSVIVQTVGVALGLFAVLFIVLKSSYASVLPTTMFVYQIICAIVVLIVSTFRKP